jgi:hypothetical protein
MRKIQSTFQFMLSLVLMFLVSLATGGYVCAADTPDGGAAQDLDNGKGAVMPGESSVTKNEQHQDADWYQKQLDKTIVEMKFTGTPIDQILRNATTNKSNSIVVKYYSVGQRPLRATLAKTAEAMTTETPRQLELNDNYIVGAMDTLLVLTPDGEFMPGYKPGTSEEDPEHPLMLRVHAISAESNLPMVYAVNGKKSSAGTPYLIPELPQGTILLRMGRAAAEKDVSTGRYYQLPEPDEQYCQRFIMQVEQTVYDRFSKKEVDWTFTRMERMAMEDMRIGMEATGLFGIKGKHAFNGQGNVYTTGGIWYRAGKDIELGHWEKVLDAAGNPVVENGKYVKRFVISEQELVDFVAAIIEGAGNGSRTKLVFVDNTIYKALELLKTTRPVNIFKSESNYQNWHLDFNSFESMGTKLLFYRHDLFNHWGFNGRAFVLDPEYLDKWTFRNWERTEYNLKELFVSNSDAVVMEEFSCWTLQFPDAHARVGIPEYVEEDAPSTAAA